jgi:hypothetical protein
MQGTSRLKRSLKLVLALASALAAPSARAEGFRAGTLFALSWETAQPAFELYSRALNDASPYGVEAELRTWLGRNFSAGFALGWNRFSSSASDRKLGAVSAKTTAQLYLTRSAIQPYVGVGAGPVWRRISGGGVASDGFFGFCAEPQLGVLFNIDRGVALHLAAKYEFTTTWAWDVVHAQWFGFQVGAAFY